MPMRRRTRENLRHLRGSLLGQNVGKLKGHEKPKTSARTYPLRINPDASGRGARVVFPRTVSSSMLVAFVHPDLGLGGAERFIIDAALALKELGHAPTIFTPFQDPSRTFAEVVPPNPDVPVRVIRSLLPRSILGRFQAILAAIRCALLALYVCLFHKFDVAVVDIVSLPVLVFALFRKPVLFYCHYPDKLLAQSLHPAVPRSRTKLLYRRIVDGLEAFSLRFASSICCNSRFTSNAFANTFPSLRKPSVIYPCVKLSEDNSERTVGKTLVSINRFERKKGVSLAIETLSVLIEKEPTLKDTKLVIAGGYDPRLPENVEYYDELQSLAVARDLSSQVVFMKNIPDRVRRNLIRNAAAILYTPVNEHLGIVPLEAMAEGVPVVATNSGGPVETIENGECGFLCESSGGAFADAVVPLLKDPEKSIEMGSMGRERMKKFFSREVLGRELLNVLVNLKDP